MQSLSTIDNSKRIVLVQLRQADRFDDYTLGSWIYAEADIYNGKMWDDLAYMTYDQFQEFEASKPINVFDTRVPPEVYQRVKELHPTRSQVVLGH